MARYKERIDRQKALVGQIPGAMADIDQYPTARRLLERFDSLYSGSTDEAKLRAIQRDLQALVQEGQVKVVNPNGHPLRYQRLAALDQEDPWLVAFTRQQAQEVLKQESVEMMGERLRNVAAEMALGDDKLRILNDNQRLLPSALKDGLLHSVLQALAGAKTLSIHYENSRGQRSEVELHPQALVQRGPGLYLFALKNDETDPVRLYALHRVLTANVTDGAARQAKDFNLSQAINEGLADFANGETIELVLRVRGYATTLLRDYPLGKEQRIEDEDEGSDFDAKVSVAVLKSGQLLRWLLGLGSNIEVLAPVELRRVMASQVSQMSRLYSNP